MLLLSVSLPAALATILHLSGKAIIETSNQLIALKTHSSRSIIVVSKEPDANCMEVEVASVKIVYGNNSFRSLAYRVEASIDRLLSLVGSKASMRKCRDCLLVGRLIYDMYRIKLGENIVVCSEASHNCSRLDVTGVFWELGGLSAAIIANSSSPVLNNSAKIYLCRDRGYNSYSVISFRRVVREAVRVFDRASLMVFFAYIPALFLAQVRVIEALRVFMRLLGEIGVSENDAKFSVLFSLIAANLVLLAYGVSIGVIASHIGFWALRFTGFLLPSRPLPSEEYFAFLAIITATATLASHTFFLLRKGGVSGRD